MIDHVSIGTHDFTSAVAFYTECFEPLGYRLQHLDAGQAIFGANGHWSFCIYPADADARLTGHRAHLAISAPSCAAADAFHEAALAQGATSLRAPGPRPDINAEYYGSMIADLDGHTIEVVHWQR
ncbi:MAG: VOC family protein [Pseudomonadota bacterium]